MIAHYDYKPEKLSSINKIKYRYRWDIHEIEVPGMMPDEPTHTQWVCNEIIVKSPLTQSYIVREAIHSVWDNDVEKKLINDYLEATASEDPDQGKIDAYKEFLTSRDKLKTQVKEDCQELGIPDV